METPNMPALSGQLRNLGVEDRDVVRMYRLYYANAPEFREESERHE
jgi:hypothetical protein